VHRYVLHNQQLRDNRDALLSPGQVGFLNGWGVFSTLRVTSGVLFAFERHYARMQRDAALLRVPFPFSREELLRSLLSLVESNQAYDAVLRVALVRNKGGLFEADDITRDVDLVAFSAPLTKWGAGVRLTYVPNGRLAGSPFSGAKITSWAENLTLYEKAHADGFDEVVLLNQHGQVSECTSANIFAIQGNRVSTPPLASSGCLPGVTRAVLLEEVHVDGIEMREEDLTRAQLEASDCVFITSTTRDLLPVLAIDGFELQQTHAVLDLVRTAFLDRRSAYIEQHSARKILVNS